MPKIIGLDGRELSWNLGKPKQNSNPSKLHLRARNVLKECFPLEIIYEEVQLKGTRTGKHGVLFADFLIYSRRLIIEVQGVQHDKYNNFFFSNKFDFFKAKNRDSDKRLWASINGFAVIDLNHNEGEEEWRRKIINV